MVAPLDTGGQGIRFKEAFDRHSDWELRSMARGREYFAYPQDLPFRWAKLEEFYQRCDVIHVRNGFEEYDRLAKDHGPKPVVLHVHGSKYRGNPDRFVREAKERNALILCSTLDLYLIAPEHSVWLPAPYDVDWLAAM